MSYKQTSKISVKAILLFIFTVLIALIIPISLVVFQSVGGGGGFLLNNIFISVIPEQSMLLMVLMGFIGFFSFIQSEKNILLDHRVYKNSWYK